MILQKTLEQVVAAQKENLSNQPTGLSRDALEALPNLSGHALIVSGIRRCGKSTLLYQLLEVKYAHAFYLNFEDPRLYEFEFNDFSRLDQVITAQKKKVLFFDEIQIVTGWERYVRRKLDEGSKLVVTGSNASLLSQELGTKLTGRHITKELFPFSFHEFSRFTKQNFSADSLKRYMEKGGFPEYLKSDQEEILNQLFDDILTRDIAVRYGIRDIKTLKRLALYLISNVGKLVTGNRLKSLMEIGSNSTVMEFLSYLENSWLLQFVPKYSPSIRKQLVNPRKVYAIDTGLVTANSGSFSEDNGRKFENLIYLHLRRRFREIYYFSEKGECDFIVFEKAKIRDVIQVCYDLNPDNLDREIDGLVEALKFFKVKSGCIVTLNQEESLERDGCTVRIERAHQFMQERL
jgi:uncharacterized protein